MSSYKFPGYGIGALLWIFIPLVSVASGFTQNQSVNPAHNANTICIANRNLSCVDADNGYLLWSIKLAGDGNEFYLDDNALIISDARLLTNYHPRTGAVRWKITFDVPIFPPTIDKNSVFISGEKGLVSRIDKQTGHQRWSRNIGSGWLYSTTGHSKSLTVVGQDHKMHVLAKDDGAILGKFELGQEPVYQPLISDDEQLIVSTFANKTLAMDPETGKPLWKANTVAPVFRVLSAGDKLIEATMDGTITVRSARSGEQIWSHKPFQTPNFKLSLDTLILAAVNQAGKFLVFELATGAVLHQSQLSAQSSFAPILRDKQLLLVASSGQLSRVVIASNSNTDLQPVLLTYPTKPTNR